MNVGKWFKNLYNTQVEGKRLTESNCQQEYFLNFVDFDKVHVICSGKALPLLCCS